MTLNWTDNAVNEVGYAIYRSTDGVNYTFINQVAGFAGTGTTISSVQTGLLGSTLYFWKLYAVTEGALSSSLDGSQSTSSCSIAAGTYSVGPTGTYASLTAALVVLNANGLTGPVILELQAAYVSTVETFPLMINAIPCAGPVNMLTIRPETGAVALSVSGTNTTAIIDINGGSYVTIDGRPGGIGTVKQLTIENTSTVTGGVALRFINGGSNNTMRYTIFKSQFPSPSSGVIVFSTTAAANGNNNNTIDNCDIDGGAAATPSPTLAAQNGIYSLGTSGALRNSGNIISNCNVFNNFVTGAATTSAGILILSGNTAWTINANSIYQTSPRTATTAAATVYGISIASSSSGNNFTVTNNFIGGSAANNAGAPWSINGIFSNRFNGIGLSTGTSPASSIQGNTISNFSFTSSSAATTNSSSTPLGTGTWGGIMIAAGNANVGTSTGNTIGAPTGTGAILVTGSSSGATVNGIGVSGTGTVVISNNNIGSITTAGSTTTISTGIIGIQSASTGTVTINANTIGSTVTGNSINASNTSTGTTAQIVTGINNTGTATAINITNNTIANLNDNYSPTTANVNRIISGIISTGGINTITGNTVRNLGTAANATGTDAEASVIGISLVVASEGLTTVSQNTVSALTNNHSTAATAVTGIHYAGPATLENIVARNNIYNLGLFTTSTAADIRGINFSTGLTTIQSNFIRLGYDTSGIAIVNGIPITGLYEVAGTAGSGIYFNSIFIGGSGTGTQSGDTYTFRTDQITAARTFQNNIFINARSNASTGGKHYAIRVAGTTVNPQGLNLNYNDYLVSGTGGILGFFNSLDIANLASWRASVGQDINSISGDPQFINAIGPIPDMHIHSVNPSPIESAGIDISSITNDFDGQTRSALTPVDMGADAGNFVLSDISVPVINYTTLTTTCSTTDRTLVVTITDASGLPTVGILRPRIYYRKNAASWFSSPGVFTSGTATNGTWTFTIVAADMGGINSPDTISYFVIAQDISTIPNIASVPAIGLVATDVNTVTTPPTTPNTYTIKNTLVGGTYTVGTTGTYSTLTAAVSVYNNSCLSGAVVFELLDATYPAETFPITINVNSDASAVNTLKIKPASGLNSTITGNSSTAIIILNGADHITIDGSNTTTLNSICPLSTASRKLTITNTNTSTNSAVIWLQSKSDSNAATYNTIKNCNIAGNSSTTTLVGIGSGSSIISIQSLGIANNNNTFESNNIKAVQVGIYSQGASGGYKNTGNVINQNVMISPSGFGQNIRMAGILVGFEDNISISGNTIGSVSGSSGDGFGISCGNIAITNALYTGNEVTDVVIKYNKIDSIRAAGTFSVAGIFITSSASPGTNIIANNSISNVATNGTSGDFGSGIFIGGGIINTEIYFNSVSMSGIFTRGSQPNFALAIGGNDPAVIIKNNVLTAKAVNGSLTTTGLGEYAIGYAYSSFNSLVSNQNDYFTSGAEAKFAKTGSLMPDSGTDVVDIAALRAATGGDLVSISADPLFNSSSNLMPQTGSPLSGAGVPIGSITNDITCITRSLTNPTIGAYENAIDAAVPVISYTALSGTCLTTNRIITATITDVSGVPISGVLQPRIYYRKNAGTYFSSQGVKIAGTATSGTWEFTINVTDMGSVVNPDVVSYFVIAQDVAPLPNIGSNPSAGLVAVDVNTVTTPPTSPNTYLIQNTLVAGTYTVGGAGIYPTLTAAVNAYNNSCLAGAIVFQLLDASYTEADAMIIAANPDASVVNTLTIRPATGVTSSVSATVNNGPVLKILGKYITIDGSNTGSTSRNLTFSNVATTMPNVLWIGSAGTTAVTNVTLKNCTLINGVNTSSAVFVCDGTVAGIPGYFNNITIQNNSIQKAYIGISSTAVVAAGNGNGLNISSNDLSATGANAISFIGIYVEGVDGATVNNNTIGNFNGTNDENDKCIWIANSTINSTVGNNKLLGLNYTGTGGYGCHGIYVSTAKASANVMVFNNSIAGLTGDGWDHQSPFLLDNPVAIALIGTQSGINVYFNSINLSGNTLNQVAAMSMGIYLGAGSIADIRDNIIVNNLGLTGTRTVFGSVGVYAVTANTQFTASNYNDYYVNPSGSGNKFIGKIAGLGSATLVAWQTATSQDMNSLAIDPLYTSSTNLALLPGSPVINAGVSIAGITTDITGATRGNPPAMGAYESKLYTSAKIFLQGAYSTALGRHKDVTAAWAAVLNANALSQPYNTAAFGNYAGTETVAGGFFTSTGATTDIVDWVLLELRDASTPSTIIARRAAFVREDGLIVDIDGLSAVSFSGTAAGNYHIAIRHRNHLGIRTATAQAVSGTSATPATYDFSAAQAQAYQDPAILALPAPNNNPAMKDFGAGKFGLWGGNGNSNTSVRANGPLALNDYLFLLNTTLGGSVIIQINNVYSTADMNMDGTVRANGPLTLNDYLSLLNTSLGGSVTKIISQHQ
jgi:hypothetical protein